MHARCDAAAHPACGHSAVDNAFCRGRVSDEARGTRWIWGAYTRVDVQRRVAHRAVWAAPRREEGGILSEERRCELGWGINR